MRVLTQFVNFVGAVQLWLAALIFVGCVMLYGAEVFARGLLNRSIPEYFEIVGIGFVYVFLFGAAALYARDEDIVIGFVYDRAPALMQPWWLFGVHTAVAASAVVTASATFDIIALQWTTPTPLLGVPESIRWIPLAIASVSMAATAGCRMAACVVWATRCEQPDLLQPIGSKEDDLREL